MCCRPSASLSWFFCSTARVRTWAQLLAAARREACSAPAVRQIFSAGPRVYWRHYFSLPVSGSLIYPVIRPKRVELWTKPCPYNHPKPCSRLQRLPQRERLQKLRKYRNNFIDELD